MVFCLHTIKREDLSSKIEIGCKVLKYKNLMFLFRIISDLFFGIVLLEVIFFPFWIFAQTNVLTKILYFQ